MVFLSSIRQGVLYSDSSLDNMLIYFEIIIFMSHHLRSRDHCDWHQQSVEELNSTSFAHLMLGNLLFCCRRCYTSDVKKLHTCAMCSPSWSWDRYTAKQNTNYTVPIGCIYFSKLPHTTRKSFLRHPEVNRAMNIASWIESSDCCPRSDLRFLKGLVTRVSCHHQRIPFKHRGEGKLISPDLLSKVFPKVVQLVNL